MEEEKKSGPLTKEDRIAFAVGRLERLVKGLEKAYLLDEKVAAKLIGSVRILKSYAEGK